MTTSTMTMRIVAGLALAAIPLAAPSAIAQGGSIAQRVASAPDGKVRFTFATRPDVCGNGDNIMTGNPESSSDVVASDCQHGPARIVLQVQNHEVTKVRTYVGGEWRTGVPATDLGNVAPQQATEYLLSLARTSRTPAGREAIFPSTLADGVTVWPTLLQIARDESLPTATHRDAVFWLGQAAGKAATADLANLAASDTVDRAIREQAVFALSQQHDAGVPELIHIAQTNRDPAIRKRAIFWLGQSNDPRALALFENLLTKPAR
jgi:hypothetical protein